MLAANDGLEGLLQRARDRPHLARADDAKVNLAQGDDFGGGAAHKHFVRDVQLVARDGLLDHVIAQVAGERDERVARDAFENVGRGRACKSCRRARRTDFRPLHSAT